MKISVDKCDQCGRLFDETAQYHAHLAAHSIEKKLEESFPEVTDENCGFSNGDYSVQRDAVWYQNYLDTITDVAREETHYAPMTYGWFRGLDDEGSWIYPYAVRLLCVCKTCYREWGQPFYANHCGHDGT